MTRDRWNSTTSRLVWIAFLASGVVITPLSFDVTMIAKNAAAQGLGADVDAGGGGVSADVGADLGGASADVGGDIGGGGASVDAGADVGNGDGDDDGGASVDAGADVGNGDDDGGASVDAGADVGDGGDSGGASVDAGADVGDDSDNGGSSADAAADIGADERGGAGELDAGSDSIRNDAPAMETSTGPSSSAGGSGDPGVYPEETRYRYFLSLDTGTAAFQRYKAAAERDNLEAAGDALAVATDRPVTLDLVDYVNGQLDVQSSFTARQIAAAANDLPLAAGGLIRRDAPGGVTDAAADSIISDGAR